MISQNFSQFALHARAILGIPIAKIENYGASASRAVVVEGKSDMLEYSGLEKVLSRPLTDMRLFGKPSVDGHRRMGVLLARRGTIKEADAITEEMLADLKIKLL